LSSLPKEEAPLYRRVEGKKQHQDKTRHDQTRQVTIRQSRGKYNVRLKNKAQDEIKKLQRQVQKYKIKTRQRQDKATTINKDETKIRQGKLYTYGE
jgi:hypothetical protein